MTSNLAEELAAAIQRVAETVQACIIQEFPENLDRVEVPRVELQREDAVRLIAAARPKVVYLIEIKFDLDEEMAEVAETLLDLGIQKSPKALVAAGRHVTSHAGETATTAAAFMVEGVLHTTSASAEWRNSFDEVVEGVVAAAKEDAHNHGRRVAAAVSAAVAAKAATLAAHPSFNFGRVSFEKRLTLAEALFGESDGLDLREVTRCAENLFWLDQSGFKREG